MTVPPADATRAQIRGSSLLLAGQAFAVVMNLAVQVLIVRYLSQESYGAFAYALSVVMIAEAVAAFGMRRGVARYVPMYEESGDLARAAGTLVLALGTVLSLGLAAVLVVAGLRGAIAGSFAGDQTAVTVLVLLIVLAPVQALGTLVDGIFAVFTRPRAIVVRRFVLTPLFRLAVVALLVAAGEGVVFLAAGYVATGLLGLLLFFPLLVRMLREHELLGRLRRGRLTVPAREVLGFTVPLLTQDLMAVMLVAASPIVLGLMATAADVAELRAVLPVVLTMGYVLSSFGLLLVPLASRLYSRSASGELNRLYWRTAVWTGVLAYPIFIICVVVAEPLTVLLFGERYADAAPVLAVLAIGQFFNAATGHNGVLLGVFGRVRFLVFSSLTGIAINTVLLLVLVPPFAAMGAAAAMSASFVIVNLIRQFGLARLTDVCGFEPAALPTYLGMIAATAVAVAAQLILSPPTALALALGATAVATVLAVARSGLALTESFPELARIPIVRGLVGAGVPR